MVLTKWILGKQVPGIIALVVILGAGFAWNYTLTDASLYPLYFTMMVFKFK